MSCSCIRGIYDFDLLFTSCADLRYVDRSVWMAGPGYTGGVYEVEVEAPSGAISTFTHVVGETTVLDWGKCVPPGIYTFRVKSCQETFEKKVPVLCKLWCGWLRAVAKLETFGSDTIREIREQLEMIPFAVSYGDITTAQALTAAVDRRLTKINCECSCQ